MGQVYNLVKSHSSGSIKYNASGCKDPTASDAIKNLEKESERFHKLLHTIFYICDLAGFSIEGRIMLKDKRTGTVWK